MYGLYYDVKQLVSMDTTMPVVYGSYTLEYSALQVSCLAGVSLVPSPIPSFSMLHAEKREGLVCDVTCVSFRGEEWRRVIIVRASTSIGSNGINTSGTSWISSLLQTLINCVTM